jgi:hypothetical protein
LVDEITAAGLRRMAALRDSRRRISLRYPSNWHAATKPISADPFFATSRSTIAYSTAAHDRERDSRA